MSPRVAVVTGSNKGIGLAIVRAFCKKFDGVVYLTARDEGRGRDAVKILESEGLKPKFHLLDITDLSSINAMKEYLVKNYGGVDVFVHNAAIAFKNADPAPFSVQAADSVRVNFNSTVNLGHVILPIMKDEGRFVTVGSFVAAITLGRCSEEVQKFFKSSDITEEQLLAKMKEFVKAAESGTVKESGFTEMGYGMSKLGAQCLTRIQARKVKELGIKNVLVNIANPGYVQTDMSSHKGDKTPDEGAETPVYVALLPRGSSEPTGEYFSDKKVDKWYECRTST